MDYGYKTDIGMVREVNEDRYLYVNEEEYTLLAVADGMGGHNAGDVASSMLIDEILKYNLKCDFLNDTEINIRKCIEMANEKIYRYAIEKPGCHGMGTTVTLAVIKGDKVYFANVGDSRGYILNESLKKITIDHSYVEELVMKGEITEDEAKKHPNRNQITRAIGTNNSVKIDIFTVDKNRDDIILLCTDGFVNMLSEKEIEDVIKTSEKLQEAVDKLVDMANDNGGCDNITVVCYKDEGGETR